MRLLHSLVLAMACAAPLSAQSSLSTPRAAPDRATKQAWTQFALQSQQAIKHAASAQAEVPDDMRELPELNFAEFFAPIGPGGLEYSEKIRALAGQRVRVRGFMVQQTERVPALFLFAGMPVKVDTRADCNETDTPPAMIHVFVPGATKALPFVPGPHFLSGTLEIGARTEQDDRISVARLVLDEPARAALFGTPPETKSIANK
jgi:hypothetical protein